MIQYIDKSALVAEIERLKADALQKKNQCKRSGLERIMHQIGAYNKILSFINTLEVKEMDLDEEINKWQGCEAFPEGVGITPLPKAMEIVERTAKHFFELGVLVSNKTKKKEL